MIVIDFERRVNKAGQQRDWVLTAANTVESQLMSTWQRVREFEPTEEDLEQDNDGAKLKCAIWRDKIEPAYNAWKEGASIPETGTPLSAWLELNKHQVKALKAAGINTVEQIAEMSESVMDKIQLLDKHAMKRSAQAFLSSIADGAAAQKVAEQDAQIAELQAQIAELSKKRGPGRPPKNAEA